MCQEGSNTKALLSVRPSQPIGLYYYGRYNLKPRKAQAKFC